MARRDQRQTPTMVDVARAAGVSVATAGRSLGAYGKVSSETKQKVLEAAAALGYAPNRLARSMRSGATRTIGFVGADVTDPFFSAALRGVGDLAHDQGYALIVTNSDEELDREQGAVDALIETRVEGLIVAPTSVRNVEHLTKARDSGIPIVLLDRDVPLLHADSVVTDNAAAVQQAVRHLIELGHRAIGYLGTVSSYEPPRIIGSDGGYGIEVTGPPRPSVDRARGFAAGLAEGGLPARLEHIRLGTRGQLEAQAVSLLSARPLPTAVITADDSATRQLIQTTKGIGLTLPASLSIVAIDDLDWMSFVEPAITAIAQQPLAMGRLAAERLFARIHGDSTEPSATVVPTELLIRNSSQPI